MALILIKERRTHMGEAKRHEAMGMGLPMKEMRPGQQIQVDLKNATPEICECGCKYFMPVMTLHRVSALVSPIGKELVAQQPALICLACKKPWIPVEPQSTVPDQKSNDV